ncbi:MAG: GtrA family protein [Oscillospiraceae bacterium]
MKLVKKLFSFFWDKSLLFFLIIGGANTVLSMLFSFLLNNYVFTGGTLGLYFSMAIPFAVLSVPSFYFNRKYSFASKAPLGKSILRFALIIAVCFHLSFFLNQLLVPWMKENWFPGIQPMLYSFIRIVGIQVVFTLLNYLGQRLWAFKPEDKPLPGTKTE